MIPLLSRRWLALGLAVALAASCRLVEGPDILRPAALVAVSGDGQSAHALSPLPLPVVLRVVDAEGRPVPGQTVHFEATGGGQLTASAARSDADGLASVGWTLGTAEQGPQSVIARARSLVDGAALEPATFHATVVPDRADRLALVRGDGQSGTAGSALPDSLVVRVLSQRGLPLEGVEVRWAATAGGGTLEPGVSVTDTAGLARAVWRLGDAETRQRATASVSGLPAVEFTAELRPRPAQVQRVSGTSQTAVAGSTLPNPLVVRVVDRLGNPVPGARVEWVVAADSVTGQPFGSVTVAAPLTDSTGQASARWTLGTAPGRNRLTAVAEGVAEGVEFEAFGGLPSNATLTLNAVLDADSDYRVAATVRYADGRPVVGARIAFDVTQGTAFFGVPGVQAAEAYTDASGVARVRLTPGSEASTVRATVYGIEPQSLPVPAR